MKRNVKRHAVVQPLDQSIRLIPLTQGQNAIVDASDYEFLSRWNWYAYWAPATKSFYAARSYRPQGGETQTVHVTMHRVIVGLGEDDPRLPDHINHDTLDNRRCNLRIATRLQSVHNRRTHLDSIANLPGVCPQHKSGKWRAYIHHKGKQIALGTYPTKEAAYEAYKEAAARLRGEFAYLPQVPAPKSMA